MANSFFLGGLLRRQPNPTGNQFDLSYGAGESQLFDIYHGKTDVGMIMIHGGGWRNGDKGLSPVWENKVAHWVPDYTFVSGNYELAVGTDPIDQCLSVGQLVAYCQQNSRDWGLNPRKWVLMGHSAGAHLVTLLNSRTDLQAEAGMRPIAGTVVIDSAAYDLTDIMTRRNVQDLYLEPWGVDDPEHWAEGSPTIQIASKPAPMLLLTSTTTNPGESDRNVGPFYDKVKALGGYAQIYHSAQSHGPINANMGLPGPDTEAVDNFLAYLNL